MSAAPRARELVRGALATLFATNILMHPGVASADPTPVKPSNKTSSLSWTRLEGADSCIGTHDLAVQVEDILKHPAIVSAAEGERSIEGRVEKTPSGTFKATVVVASSAGVEQGRRVIETKGHDCRELDEDLALSIALMIDPDALSAPKDPPKVDPPKIDPPKIEPPKDLPKIDPPKVDEPPSYRIEGFAGAVTSLGLTPLSGGFMGGVLFDPSFFGAFEVDLAVTTSSNLTNAAAPSNAARFWKFEGSAYYCPLAGVLPDRGSALFQGALCAGGQAGFVSASGDDLAASSAGIAPLVGGALRGRAGAFIYPVSLGVGATLSIPITRQTYAYVDGAGAPHDFFSSAPVAGTFDVTIGLEFPRR